MANLRNDILLDDKFNAICDDGDFVIGNSDAQNVQMILTANKGDFKETPVTGCNLVEFVKKTYDKLREIKREIIVQLKSDGYKTLGFNIDNEHFTLDYKPDY